MKISLFSIILFFFYPKLGIAQQLISGIVVDENGNPLSGIQVINIQKDFSVYTNKEGNFTLKASIKDEIRLVSNAYERLSYILEASDFGKVLRIRLSPKYVEIEEVKIDFIPTGNLERDVSKFRKSEKRQQMEKKIEKSIALGEDRFAPKPSTDIPRTFNRTPIIKGGFMPKHGSRSSIMEIADWVQKSLGDDYFLEMGISGELIDPFITYCLKFLDTSQWVEHANYTQKDLVKIQVVMEQKKNEFKK